MASAHLMARMVESLVRVADHSLVDMTRHREDSYYMLERMNETELGRVFASLGGDIRRLSIADCRV